MTDNVYHGGYDLELVSSTAGDRYSCQICAKVLRDPHLAVCCGQHFCESCLKEWFRKQRGKESCPHCRAEGAGFNHVIHKGLRSEISQLKIKCRNHEEGCKWKGEIGELEAHLTSCGFVAVKCSNKCKDQYDKPLVLCRKDMKKHLNLECDLRPYQCEYCGYKDTFLAVTGRVRGRKYFQGYFGGHQAICPEISLTCPNECGQGSIKRKDMDRHRSWCPQEPVECPFAEAGCKEKLRRSQLDSHMNTSQQQHLLLVMKDSRETKRELLEVKGALSAALRLLKQGKEADKEIMDFLITSSMRLTKSSDAVQVVMPRFSEYRRSGKVWHSPPFHYQEGYRMCLAVYANGVGYGAGTHISVSLLLLAGARQGSQRKLSTQNSCAAHTAPYIREDQEWLKVCAYQPLSQYSQTITELIHKEKFCSQTSNALHFVNDCLAFNIEYANDCCLVVSVR